MVRSLARIMVILALAAGAGYIRARDLPWILDMSAIRDREQKLQWLRANAGVTLDELLELIEQGAIVIDARPAADFEQEHLDTGCEPPILNVPPEQIDEHIDRLLTLRGFPIVLYCTSLNCEYSEDLYIELENFGFFGEDMKIYFPGWEDLRKAGLPLAAGPDVWTGFDDMSGDPNDVGDSPTDPNGAEP